MPPNYEPKRVTYREILIFLPREDENAPGETARALLAHLNVVQSAVGVDVLTGNVEVRLHYDPTLLRVARAYLEAAGVPFEIDAR